MSATTKFTITYCKNWDGGKQEYNTALEALRRVYPKAKVIENRVDDYPIKVTVTATTSEENTTTEIWSGRQQDLFSKYRAKRTKSMAAIETALQEYQQQQTSKM